MSSKKKDEVDKARRLDTSNPRIQAAMRIKGITKENILPQAKLSAADEQSPIAKKNFESLEKKRLNLMSEVEALAETTPEEDAEEILAPHTNQSSQSMQKRFSAGVLEKEQQKLEALKKRTKEEVQRIVSDNLLKAQKAEEGVRRNEESRQRLQQLRNERKLQVEAQKKEQAKKEAGMKDTLRKLTQKVEEEGQETTNRLDAVWQKLEAQRQDAVQAKYQATLEWRLKLGERRERIDQEVKASQRQRDLANQSSNEKAAAAQQRVDEHLEAQRQKAATGQEKFDQKRAAVLFLTEQKQLDRETAFRHSADNFLRAREDGAKIRAASAQAIGDSGNKRRGMVNKNLEGLNNLRKEKAKAIQDKAEQDVAGQNRLAWLEEEKRRRTEQREMMGRLYLENRERMARAESYGHGHALRDVTKKVDRVNGVLEQRQEILDQRANTLKESLKEKDNLHEMLVSMKSAAPDTVNKLLKTLDMPLISVPGTEEKKEEK